MDRRKMLLGLSSVTATWQSKLWGRLSPRNGENVAGANAAPALSLPAQDSQTGGGPDIRKLSQHFFSKTNDISPWRFIPEGNIKSLSTTTHPGFVSIQHGDEGKDIKGILKDPIKIDDYPLPWEFHLGLAGETYMLPCNQAVGVNLALTFSDPSTWPSDRTQTPPDTHTLQLLQAHLRGPQIESGPLNGYRPAFESPPDGIRNQHGADPYVKPTIPKKSGELWVLFGRGDLAPNVLGNWKIPYTWVGYPEGAWGDHPGGMLSHSLTFRVRIVSPTEVDVGFFGGLQGEPHLGWQMRTFDVSRFGKITGIWEIGPVIALDGWLADDLPGELGISASPPFKVSDPAKTYMVDYGVFFGANAENYDHWSDDFDIPGFPSPKWFHEAGAITDTYTHPGYLTVTLLPQSPPIWAMTPTAYGQGQIDLTQNKDFPGWEMEVAFIPPDPEIHPWKVMIVGWSVWTESGRSVGYGYPPGGGWMPGVEYLPKEKRFRINSDYSLEGIEAKSFDLVFDPEVPQSLLSHKPLYILSQILDASHLRLGFKARKEDPWHLSKPFDVTKVWGEKIGKFDPARGFWGGVSSDDGGPGIGNYPHYPRFLFDYVYYRKGLSTPK